jgi:Transcriptional regulator, AbiEi antitoxin
MSRNLDGRPAGHASVRCWPAEQLVFERDRSNPYFDYLLKISYMSYTAVVARYSTLSRIARIAEDQWGLITRRQAEGTGVSQATLQRLAKTGILDRVAHGVYRLSGAPLPDHLDLRAAWLQLAPEVPGWERTPEQGVVSHRSAAALYGLGHLPADRHEFTLPERRQSRRSDVRLHHRAVRPGEWIVLQGMPVTRPSRIAADLLDDKEDPEAVAQVIADALAPVYDYPGAFVDALAPYAASFGLRRGDGLALLRWLLDKIGDPEASRWIEEARGHAERSADRGMKTPARSQVKGRRR